MKYLLTLQDEETHIVWEPRIDQVRWGKKRKAETSLIATTECQTTKQHAFLTIPCDLVKDMRMIKQ